MCECFASMYVHTMYMPGAHGGSKSALDPLLTGIVAVLKVSGHVCRCQESNLGPPQKKRPLTTHPFLHSKD